MKEDLSLLSLTELYDKLSESTASFSKSMLNGLTEKEFTELRLLIEEIQKEITGRKASSSNTANDPTSNFSASA